MTNQLSKKPTFSFLNQTLEKFGIELAQNKQTSMPSLNWSDSWEETALALNNRTASGLAVIIQDETEKFMGSSSSTSNTLRVSVDSVLKNSIQAKELVFLTLSESEGYKSSEKLAHWHCVETLAKQLKELRLKHQDISMEVIVVGSGSVSDVTKHAIFLNRQKHSDNTKSSFSNVNLTLVPTALTVTAFTSGFAVLEKETHKSTYNSCIADEVHFNAELLKGAPESLQKAGVGDLLAGFVSYADWKLSSLLGFEKNYNDAATKLMNEMQRHFFFSQEGSKSYQDSQTLFRLSECLSAAGLAMNMGNSSAPQSGGEHAVSHVLDYLRTVSSRQKWPHGLQVGMASLASCGVYDWLKEFDFIPLNRLGEFPSEEIGALVQAAFQEAPFEGGLEFQDIEKRNAWVESNKSQLTESLLHFQSVAVQKNDQWQELKQRFVKFQELWETEKAEVFNLVVSADDMHKLLLDWKLPVSPEEMSPVGHSQEFRFALRFSPFFRSRFGIADFAFWLGEDPVIAAAV